MLTAGDRFDDANTGASFEVLRAPAAGERTLEIRRTLRPGTGKVLPHEHLDYAERFVVESGRATAKLAGRTMTLDAGDELEVPVGTAHVNAYNDGSSNLVVRHVFEPVSDFALAYVETLGHLMRRGKTDRQGEVPVAAAFAVGHATGSQTFAVGLPRGLQRRVLLPVGAAVARVRGYELFLPA